MIFPIAIEPASDTTAFGVIVLDLPGCFSAGDTLDDAMTCAHEAAAAWIDAALDTNQTIPLPSSLDAVRSMPDYAGWVFGVIDVDAAGR